MRKLALTLPRTTEGVVRERVRFRIGRIVYLGFSHDEELMGFAFPKEERQALVDSEPVACFAVEDTGRRRGWSDQDGGGPDGPGRRRRPAALRRRTSSLGSTGCAPAAMARSHQSSGRS